jgi:hypothetical protein
MPADQFWSATFGSPAVTMASTRIPEGSLSMTGIGCHTMVNFVESVTAGAGLDGDGERG